MADGSAIWNFEGKVVCVTGAGEPRGAAQVRIFAAAGATVVACDSKVPTASEPDGPGTVEIREVDVADETAVTELARSIESGHGRLDILVVNDRGFDPTPLLDLEDEGWRELVKTHLTSAFLCVKHLAPLMFPQESGKIVFTTGQESTAGAPGRAHASSLRHALFGLAKCSALEVAPHKVNVNVAAAAPEVDQGGPDQEKAAAALAHLVAWFGCDAARFVTGTVVRADLEQRPFAVAA
jgi:NAD(P)-dependent dehydrogenase (short-subunit alcohol dehydrogenase family)